MGWSIRLPGGVQRLVPRLIHGSARFVRPLTMGVRAAVERDGPEGPEVFLVRHTYVAGWHLPGGAVEVGETAGDAVLREMGALTAGTLRADEFAGRYGGEEILVVLRNEDGRAVSRLAAFHHRVRDHGFGKAGAPGVLAVTCSIGLAAVFRGDNWETLIGRADRALYHAKRTGRDRIAGLAEAAILETEGVPERTRLGDAT